MSLACLLTGLALPAQQAAPPPPVGTIEQEPPEEDPDRKPQEYSFNPLEAGRNMTAGNFYYKKGNYRAAFRRYVEATKWDPTSGQALLKLSAASEKLRDFEGARSAYTKYLELEPDAKNAPEIKTRLAKLPAHAPPAATPANSKTNSKK